MNALLRRAGIALVVAAISLSASPLARAEKFEQNLDKSFTVRPGGKLMIRADGGAITVSTTDSNQVSVRVYRSVEAATQAKADEVFGDHPVAFDQSGDEVSVTARNMNEDQQGSGTQTTTYHFFFFKFTSKKSWGNSRNGDNLRVSYEVMVPRQFNLDLKTYSGAVIVPDLTGDARTESSGGELKFGQIDGSVWGKTYSGAVRVAGATGPIEVKTSGGSIEVGPAGRSVNAETYSGSVTVKSAKESVRAKTSGGNITIGMVDGALKAETYSGNVRVQSVGGRAEVKTSGGDLEVGEAGDDVTAQTYSGTITVRSAKGKVNAKDSGGDIRIGKAGLDVMATTYSGTVSVESCGGRVEAKTSGGNISLGQTSGNVQAETYSGTITIKKTGGSIAAKNSGGSIDLGEIAGSATARTFSGSISATLPAHPTGDYRLETTSGDIRLAIPETAAVDLVAKANGGRVVAEVPVEVHGEQKRGLMQGKINGGGVPLALNTSSGSIYLRKP